MSAIDIAIPLIRREEGCRLEAYPDPATGGDPWTIGYGATGAGIRRGTVWTLQQAEEDLEARVLEIAQQILDEVQVELSDNQLGALISFVYNVGIGRHDNPGTAQDEGTGFRGSTLLERLNAGDYQGAADQMLRWNRAGGRVNKGLAARRERERALFLAPDA
jgi:lysozyme